MTVKTFFRRRQWKMSRTIVQGTQEELRKFDLVYHIIPRDLRYVSDSSDIGFHTSLEACMSS